MVLDVPVSQTKKRSQRKIPTTKEEKIPWLVNGMVIYLEKFQRNERQKLK
jgi:hypothetical protein